MLKHFDILNTHGAITITKEPVYKLSKVYWFIFLLCSLVLVLRYLVLISSCYIIRRFTQGWIQVGGARGAPPSNENLRGGMGGGQMLV